MENQYDKYNSDKTPATNYEEWSLHVTISNSKQAAQIAEIIDQLKKDGFQTYGNYGGLFSVSI